ncbi:hypothetical protein Taro_048125 [Colocasia esculenta]|uniref:Cystatin domain-containing protein n=1 Tax=Colocasia esculenta TaxID=4460 RepID=A0A843X299_COLES|nr:hypothetical protein [Colocasia esculenta]
MHTAEATRKYLQELMTVSAFAPTPYAHYAVDVKGLDCHRACPQQPTINSNLQHPIPTQTTVNHHNTTTLYLRIFSPRCYLVFLDYIPSFTLVIHHHMAQVSGYQPIADIDDPYVQEIGKFAVEEHNKQAGQGLVFVRVVSGEQQVVAGTNYKLVIAAEDAGATNKYEAVVYDKPWENFRELTSFAIMPKQVVKQVGGYQPIPNIKDPHVLEIAKFAVAEYNKQAGKALVFVSVVSGEQQVVAGTNYKLVIVAEDCGVFKMYEAVLYDKSWEKVRELTSFNPMHERVVKKRSFEMRVGGYQPIRNVMDPHIQEIGKFAVEEHNKQADKALVFVCVVNGEQQVIAVTNYKLVIAAEDAGAMNKYEAVVYDKPWENFRELTCFAIMLEQVVKQVYQSLLLYRPRLPYSFASPSQNTYNTMATKVGGYQPIQNIKDVHVLEIAEFAVAEYNKQAGKALVFISVVSGEQQVVAGTNYKLVIEAEDCGVIKTYEVVVYDKSWEKVRELTSFNPMPERVVKKRSFEMRVGSYQPIRNVMDPHVQEIGKFAVEEHNKQAGKALVFVCVVSGEQQRSFEMRVGGYQPIRNVMDPHVQDIGKFTVEEHNKQADKALVFVSVVSGEQQVVAGTNYKLVVTAEDAGETNKYEVVVYDKPWENFRELTSFAIMTEQAVKKVGGYQPIQNIEDPHVLEIAEFAMRVGGYQPIRNVMDPHVQEIGKFEVEEHNKQADKALVFVCVVSGEQQVVAGTNHKLVVTAEDAGAMNKYEAVVYDKPWENFRELTCIAIMPEQVVKQVYQSLLLYRPRLPHSFASPSQNTYHTMATKVGGYQPIQNIKDPHVVEIVEFAVAEYNKQAGKALVFVSVVSGEQQVVAGTNYKLIIEAEDCCVIKTYEAVVYDKSWKKVRELTSFNPVPEWVVKKVGGYQPIPNIKDPHVLEIAEFAVEEYNKQAGKALVFVSVVSGDQQVVAGTNYKLVIEAEDCGVIKTYEAVVYDKSWEKVRELTSFNPMPERIVKQRSFEMRVGHYQPIRNVKDPHVQEISKFAVEEHNK